MSHMLRQQFMTSRTVELILDSLSCILDTGMTYSCHRQPLTH